MILKLIPLLFCFFVFSSFACELPSEYKNLSCSGIFFSKNSKDLELYKKTLGRTNKDETPKNLVILTSVKGSELNLLTPCKVTLLPFADLNFSNRLCINAREGISGFGKNELSSHSVVLKSKDEIHFFVDSKITSRSVEIRGNDLSFSNGTEFFGGNFLLEGFNEITLGKIFAKIDLLHTSTNKCSVAKKAKIEGKKEGSCFGGEDDPLNVPPTAKMLCEVKDLTVFCEAKGSSDEDGVINSYVWKFGPDGGRKGYRANFTFSKAGSYEIKLTVTDNKGATDTISQIVTLGGNLPPVASMNCTTQSRTVNCTSTSNDPDGTISKTLWKVDNKEFLETSFSNTFLVDGDYVVELTVWDNFGLSSKTSQTLSVKNLAPLPSMDCKVQVRTITCNSNSSDLDGTISKTLFVIDGKEFYSTSFSYTVTTDGDFPVELTVWDNLGTSAKTTQAFSLNNLAPHPDIKCTVEKAKVSCDGTLSYDSDGFIAKCIWDYDGETVEGISSTHTYSSAGTHTIKLKVIDNLGKEAETTQAVEIIPNQVPVIDAFSCVAQNKNAQCTLSAHDPDGNIVGINYSWGDGTSSSTGEHIYQNAGSFTIRVTVTDSQGAEAFKETTLAITNPPSDLTAKAICYLLEGSSVHCDASLSKGNIQSLSWDLGNGETLTDTSFDYVYNENGDYQIKLTVKDAFGQTKSDTNLVSIGSDNIRLEPAADCWHSAPYTLTCSAKGSVDPDGSIRDTLWESEGVKKLGEEVQFVYDSEGEKALQLTIIDNQGLAFQTSGKVEVFSYDPPKADFDCTVEKRTFHCDGSASSSEEGDIVEYYWQFDEREISTTTPKVNFEFPVNSESVPVRLVVKDSVGHYGRSTVKRFAVNYSPVPVANFECSIDRLIVNCDSSSSSVDVGKIVEQRWNFGDGETVFGPTPSHFFPTTGTKTITLTVKSDVGVEASIQKDFLIVNTLPFAEVVCDSYSPLTYKCYIPNMGDPDGWITNFKWIFDDGRVIENEFVVEGSFANGGAHSLDLILTDNFGGIVTVKKEFSVLTNQGPVFESLSCSSNRKNASCSVSAYDPDGYIARTVIDWGDNSGQQGLTHYYSSYGTYNITVTVFDNAGASQSRSTTLTLVNQLPIATISCNSSSQLSVYCQVNSVSDPDGSVSDYHWIMDNGTVVNASGFSYNYPVGGSHYADFVVTDNDGGITKLRTTFWVIPNEAPVARFTCTTKSRTITCDATASSDLDGRINEYDWDFGNGTTGRGQWATNTFSEDGTYAVSLTVTDAMGASSTRKQNITVKNALPEFTFSCHSNSALQLYCSLSTWSDSDGYVAKMQWTLDDGTSGDGASFNHQFAKGGAHAVTFTLTDEYGGATTQTESFDVISHKAPLASFTLDKTQGLPPLEVAYDASASASYDGATIATYSWDFKNGETSTDAKGSVSFDDVGKYQVTLTVTDSLGYSSSLSKVVGVSHMPIPKIATDKVEGVLPLTVAFSATESQANDGSLEKFEWSFGDGGKSEGEEVSYTYNYPGTYYATLTLTDSLGGQSATQTQITVLPADITFYSRPPEFAISGEQLKYTPDVRTATETELSFYLQNAPTGMTINQTTGEITWTPTNLAPTKYTFKIVATDNDKTVEQTVTLDSYVPRVIASQMITASEGGTITVSGSGTNLDGMTVEIPADAFESDTNVAISVFQSSSRSGSSPYFKLNSLGILNSPLKISIPVGSDQLVNDKELADLLVEYKYFNSISTKSNQSQKERTQTRRAFLRPDITQNILSYKLGNLYPVMRYFPSADYFFSTQSCSVGALDAFIYGLSNSSSDLAAAKAICKALKVARIYDNGWETDGQFAFIIAPRAVFAGMGFEGDEWSAEYAPFTPETIYVTKEEISIDKKQQNFDTVTHEYFHKIQWRKLHEKMDLYSLDFWSDASAEAFSYWLSRVAPSEMITTTSSVVSFRFGGTTSNQDILEFAKDSLGISYRNYSQFVFFDYFYSTQSYLLLMDFLDYLSINFNPEVLSTGTSTLARELLPLNSYALSRLAKQLPNVYIDYIHELLDVGASSTPAIQEIRKLVTNGWKLSDRELLKAFVNDSATATLAPMAGTSYTIDPNKMSSYLENSVDFLLKINVSSETILMQVLDCPCVNSSGDIVECSTNSESLVSYGTCKPIIEPMKIEKTQEALITTISNFQDITQIKNGTRHLVINTINPLMEDGHIAKFSYGVEGGYTNPIIVSRKNLNNQEVQLKNSSVSVGVLANFAISSLPEGVDVKWKCDNYEDCANGISFSRSFATTGPHVVKATFYRGDIIVGKSSVTIQVIPTQEIVATIGSYERGGFSDCLMNYTITDIRVSAGVEYIAKCSGDLDSCDERGFSVGSKKPSNGTVTFVLMDEYGNSKTVARSVNIEARKPEVYWTRVSRDYGGALYWVESGSVFQGTCDANLSNATLTINNGKLDCNGTVYDFGKGGGGSTMNACWNTSSDINAPIGPTTFTLVDPFGQSTTATFP